MLNCFALLQRCGILARPLRQIHLMKHNLLTIACCLLSYLGLAQSAALPTQTIKGTIIDSVSKKPVGYATVAVQDAATKQPVRSALAKDDGSFALKVSPGKTYQLAIAFVGYKTKILPLKNSGEIVNVGINKPVPHQLNNSTRFL